MFASLWIDGVFDGVDDIFGVSDEQRFALSRQDVEDYGVFNRVRSKQAESA
jgi:hypothetical protein